MGTRQSSISLRARAGGLAAVFVVVLTALAIPLSASAAQEEVVNVTIRIPADVRPNPCTPGDVVTLSGELHIVIYMRSDERGGYHVNQLLAEKLQGRTATGELYVASDVYGSSFYAGAPLPVTNTITHSVELVSKGESPNLLTRYDVHTTVNAAGVPTATVTNIRTECTGVTAA